MQWMVGLILLLVVPAGVAQQSPQDAPTRQDEQSREQDDELVRPLEMRELSRMTTQVRDILRDLSYLMERDEMAKGRPAVEIAELIDFTGDILKQMSTRIEEGDADINQREDINQRLTGARLQLDQIERYREGP